MGIMKIPRGNIMELRLGTKMISENVPIINSSEISLKITTNFKQVMKSDSNMLMGAISNFQATSKLGSGVIAAAGYQMWESTSPITFSTESIFYMRTSGLNDVVKPMHEIMKLAVPTRTSDAYTLIAPGPTIKAALSDEVGKDNAIIDALFKVMTSKGNLSLRIGNFINLSSVVITSAEPTYSMDVDSDGYPIQGALRLEFMTLDICNTAMIDNLLTIPSGYNKESV